MNIKLISIQHHIYLMAIFALLISQIRLDAQESSVNMQKEIIIVPDDTVNSEDKPLEPQPAVSTFAPSNDSLLNNNSDNDSSHIPDYQRKAGAQGILVITDDPESEIVIDGKVRGKGEQLFIDIAPGKYTVAARKNDCFDDYEKVYVNPGEITTVTVRARAVRIIAVPPSYSIIISEKNLLHGMQMGAGLWYKRHQFCGFYTSNGGPGTSLRSDTVDQNGYFYESWQQTSIGVHYSYAAVANQYAQLGIGATIAWGLISRESYYNSYSTYVSEYSYDNEQFMLYGPRMSFLFGLEHFKINLSGSYLIRSDTEGVVADERNFLLAQTGIVIIF